MNQAQQPEVNELCKWFDEEGGFKQGTAAPHKWVLQANSEIHRLHARVQELECQQKREPLSYQQISDAWYDCGIGTTYDIAPSQDDIDWARAIERAHGITAQPEYHTDDDRDHSDEDAAIAAGKIQAAVQRRTS